jgi:AmiR/NasT family two-component response regulator
MGVVMLRRGVTREEAFDLLRFASQTSNRKLHTIASEVADAGDLDLPPTSPAAADGRAG